MSVSSYKCRINIRFYELLMLITAKNIITICYYVRYGLLIL